MIPSSDPRWKASGIPAAQDFVTVQHIEDLQRRCDPKYHSFLEYARDRIIDGRPLSVEQLRSIQRIEADTRGEYFPPPTVHSPTPRDLAWAKRIEELQEQPGLKRHPFLESMYSQLLEGKPLSSKQIHVVQRIKEEARTTWTQLQSLEAQLREIREFFVDEMAQFFEQRVERKLEKDMAVVAHAKESFVNGVSLTPWQNRELATIQQWAEATQRAMSAAKTRGFADFPDR